MTQVMQDAAGGLLGHNALLQPAARLGADVTDNYGRLRPKGTSVPLREDFNTLDNPFTWSPQTGFVTPNAPGMHFVAFLPGQPPVPPGPQGDGRRDARRDELSRGALQHLG